VTAKDKEQQILFDRLKDRAWRLDNLYWVQDGRAQGRKVKFRMNWAQRRLYDRLWWLNVVLKVRQLGISTFTAIFILDRCLFTKDQTCGIIDRTDPEAVKKLQKVEYAYDHLDDPDDPETAVLGKAIKAAVQRTAKNDHLHEFSNGSQIWAGITMRGATVNLLWVSEMGTIAHKEPNRANEIAAGSFNTVHPGNIIIVESTHEGGRYGLNYELIQQARKCPPDPTPLDWDFHFFAWWQEPTYSLPVTGPVTYSRDEEAYFAGLEATCGITLTPEQKYWWMKKSRSPRVDMARQYPGTPEEALAALVEGAIYGREMAQLRAQRRIIDFNPDGTAPLYTAWDIGQSDYCSKWLFQFVGMDLLLLEYHAGVGETPAESAAVVTEWEHRYGRSIKANFLPHDANNRGSVGKTFVDALRDSGLGGITIVPRTPDVWVGIQHLRTLLPRAYIHATHCGKEFETPSFFGDVRVIPSGIASLDGYHRKIELFGGAVVEKPVHDGASHGADALRTMAEGHMRGMLANPARNMTHAYGLTKVTTGIRDRPSHNPLVREWRGRTTVVR
jgi:hypothetical protein